MSKSNTQELPTPANVRARKDVHELLRVWVVDGGLAVSMGMGFEDPSVWGLALVDIARHAARIYAAEGVCAEAEAIERIRTMWNAEIAAPTDLGTTKPHA
jgi:hypothetical protein